MSRLHLFGAVALATASVACAVHMTGEGEMAGAKVKGTVDVDTRKVSVEPSDALPPGTCVKITWTDGSGNPIGTPTEAEVGGEPVDVPPGAEGATVSPCDPPPKKKTTQRSSLHFTAQDPEPFPYFEIPVDFTDGRGRWVEFTVGAANRAQADVIAQDFLTDMLLEPCPAQVTPYGIAEAELLADGRVRYTAFSTSAPASFDFRWNGAQLFTLADATVTAASGWYATTVIVPAGEVETPLPGFPAANEASFALGTAQRTISLSNTFEVEL